MDSKNECVTKNAYDADIKVIDELCLKLREVLKDADKDSKDVFACDLLLREILLNAIGHGAAECVNQKFILKLSVTNKYVRITVKDSGCGFNHRQQMDKKNRPTQEHGRGLQIIKLYSHKYRFNMSGSCISVIRYLM